MWTELKPTDKIEVLNDFANIRKEFGCARSFTGNIVKNNMLYKIDCSYYKLNTKKFTILLGFKYNQGTEKMTWMTFLIINCIETDYPEALGKLAKKTKEILEKKQLDLLNEYDYKELEAINQTFKFGYYKTFDLLKNEFEKIGLKCNFNDNRVEVSW